MTGKPGLFMEDSAVVAPKSPTLSSLAGHFPSPMALMVTTARLAQHSNGSPDELGQLLTNSCGEILRIIVALHSQFDYELNRIGSERIYDAYLKREGPPRIKRQLGDAGTHSEALSRDLELFFRWCEGALNDLSESDEKPPIRLDTTESLVSRASSLSAGYQFVFWVEAADILARIVGLDRELERFTDIDTRIGFCYRLKSLLDAGKSTPIKWEARITGIKIEEAMLRVDYPELFAGTEQQAETPATEESGAAEWSRPMHKQEAGKLYGCKGDNKAKARFISNLIKDGTLVTDQVDQKSRKLTRFDLSTVDEAVREKFRVQPSS